VIGGAVRRLRTAITGRTPADRFLDLVAAGGARFEAVVYTRNRRVMASVADGGRTLRVHEAFTDAPPEVLRALGTLFARGRNAGARARARQTVRAYLATTDVALRSAPLRPRAAPARPCPGDDLILSRLRSAFDIVNERHFAGQLPAVPIRLSDRMRRRNGHFRADPPEIAISRALCTRAADGEAEHTLRHEMIHLWQWATGRKPDHGAEFRHWARVLDVHPRARRHVRWLA
jgi:hypothetical protein